MKVGAITTPKANQVKTCRSIVPAHRLARVQAARTSARDRPSQASTSVKQVVSRFAGTRKAQMAMQWATEKSETVWKRCIGK